MMCKRNNFKGLWSMTTRQLRVVLSVCLIPILMFWIYMLLYYGAWLVHFMTQMPYTIKTQPLQNLGGNPLLSVSHFMQFWKLPKCHYINVFKEYSWYGTCGFCFGPIGSHDIYSMSRYKSQLSLYLYQIIFLTSEV